MDKSRSRISGSTEIERLVTDHWHLVEVTVQKAHPRLSASDREECEAAGYLALVQAAQCFDPSRGAVFQTHAISRIRWAVNEAALQCQAGVFAHRRMERWSEIAGLPRLLALDSPAPGRNGGETGQTIGELIPDGRRGIEQTITDREGQRYLWQVVKETLQETQCAIIEAHYRQKVPLREIARAQGVSHQRISQLHRQAIRALREKMPHSLVN
ncbi:MAG: sigma-70 family RNA polymerase sigma factor [Armatimonadota bacterium]